MTTAQSSETPMEIPFRGQYDVKVLRRMYRTTLTPSRSILILGSLFGLSVILATLAPLFHGDSVRLEAVLPLIVFVLIGAGILGYRLFVLPRSVLQSSILLQSPIVGEAKEAGVRIETEHSRSEMPWEAFLKRKIGKGIVLLYLSIQVINVLPREFFATEADWQAFVDLVRRRVPERAPRERAGRSWKLYLVVLWLVIFVIVILFLNFFQR
jgi:hypothetical protein